MNTKQTKEQIYQDIFNKLGDNWQTLERKGEILHFATFNERANYEYKRMNSAPKTQTAEQREAAWAFLTGETHENEEGPLNITLNGLGDSASDFSKYFGPAIEIGMNTECSIRQAYAFLQVAEGKKNDSDPLVAKTARDFSEGLLAVINNIKTNEMSSPYYELKQSQQQIERLKEQLGKSRDYDLHERLNKKIQEEENSIADFLDSCEQKGLDREIAEEYLTDCKANMSTEKARRAQAQRGSSETGQPSTNGARPAQTQTYNPKIPEPEKAQKQSQPKQDEFAAVRNMEVKSAKKQDKEEEEQEVDEYGVRRSRKVDLKDLSSTFKDIANEINEEFGRSR